MLPRHEALLTGVRSFYELAVALVPAMEEDVALPSVMLASRQGRLVALTAHFLIGERWCEKYVDVRIREHVAQYEVGFRGELFYVGLSHQEATERLAPFDHGRYGRELGYWLHHQVPQLLTSTLTALTTTFQPAAAPYWVHDPIDPIAPIATATLTLPRAERPFPETLEEFLANLLVPGTRSLTGTYQRP